MPTKKEQGGAWVLDYDSMPDWLQRHIDRDRTSPRCRECHGSMSKTLFDLGASTHPCCKPDEKVTAKEYVEGLRLLTANTAALAVEEPAAAA